KADPPPGEGHFGISNVVNVGPGQYYQPDHHAAASAQAQRIYALVMHGVIDLHARREAGLAPIYAGDMDALGLIPREGPGSDIVKREAARLALFAYVGQFVLRTEEVPAPISDEAFMRMVNRSAS
ncbi:MAG: hypothetical protein ABJH52_17280, partial [Henriciella sp.]